MSRITLPPSETALLNTLPTSTKRVRAAQLHKLGWTLASIAEAFTPPLPRSTVQYWVTQYKDVTDVEFVKHKRLSELPPAPIPPSKPNTSYIRKTPVSAAISPSDAERLADLAPIARQYRSGMASTSLQFRANEEFDELIRHLYNGGKGTSVSDIARAANVTHRVISRRLKKGTIY